LAQQQGLDLRFRIRGFGETLQDRNPASASSCARRYRLDSRAPLAKEVTILKAAQETCAKNLRKIRAGNQSAKKSLLPTCLARVDETST
jgi:hypothetical protein